MNGKHELSRAQVDQIAREVIGANPIRSESSDALFLARFRQKLAAYRKPPESLLSSIARLSWHMAPLTALATIILTVGLISQPKPPTLSEEMWERVLSEIADEQKTEVSQDLLVEAVLLGPSVR